MTLWTSALVAAALLLVAAGLIFWNLRQWRSIRPESLAENEYGYRWRQFRRRIQTSAMLGLAGAAFFAGDLLHEWIDSDLFFLIYYLALLLLILWIVALAVVDVWATKFYYDRLRNKYFNEKLKLEAELRRRQARGSNGKPPEAE